MGIPMGMGMGWVSGLKFNPHGSPALNAYTSFQSVTITYTNVLLFYVISFSVLIDCLLIYCVVFIVLLTHCFSFL